MSIFYWVIAPTRLYLWNQDKKGQPKKNNPGAKENNTVNPTIIGASHYDPI